MVEKYCLLKNCVGGRMLPRSILAKMLIIFPAGTSMDKTHRGKNKQRNRQITVAELTEVTLQTHCA